MNRFEEIVAPHRRELVAWPIMVDQAQGHPTVRALARLSLINPQQAQRSQGYAERRLGHEYGLDTDGVDQAICLRMLDDLQDTMTIEMLGAVFNGSVAEGE